MSIVTKIVMSAAKMNPQVVLGALFSICAGMAYITSGALGALGLHPAASYAIASAVWMGIFLIIGYVLILGGLVAYTVQAFMDEFRKALVRGGHNVS